MDVFLIPPGGGSSAEAYANFKALVLTVQAVLGLGSLNVFYTKHPIIGTVISGQAIVYNPHNAAPQVAVFLQAVSIVESDFLADFPGAILTFVIAVG